MAVRFENIFVETDGAKEDEDSPLVVELTIRGDLVFHNWDYELDLAVAELGFEPSTPLILEQSWYDLKQHTSYELSGEGAHLIHERTRVIEELREIGLQALAMASFNRPPGWDTKGLCDTQVHIFSVSPTDNDRVLILLNYARVLQISVQNYMDVVNLIPDGIVFDVLGGRRLVAVAIETIVQKGVMVARVGRPINGGTNVVTTRAMIQWDKDAGYWTVRDWL